MNQNSNPLSTQLEEGLMALGISLPESARKCLLDYCDLLAKWNRTYNLTSITEPAQMISYHLLDSLAVLPHLPIGRVIDIGTGPGLPGIPLSIARPEQQFVLLDSNGKKTRFINQAVGELGLRNVTVINERVENYQPEEKFDVVISRAFASINDMLEASVHLVTEKGLFLAMKGKCPHSEIEQLLRGFELISAVPLTIKGLDAERHLLMLGRS
ncbi:MAG: 16S rRNA (guanine(527)-N(7))-methyltransferase RsmG [Gammaproteobacteria bacterium]|nr:16S rRNA (guanine(527)-N(7))-methyltransferase RsmG [Gammaproteobacteria bacterium]